MANVAVRVWPVGPEMAPDFGGLLKEVWRITGDNSSATMVITPEIVRKIYFVTGNGASNSLTATPGSVASSVTFTFLANIGAGIKHDVIIFGKA
jgi:hypothetical protein